jgi:hypothetical protein
MCNGYSNFKLKMNKFYNNLKLYRLYLNNNSQILMDFDSSGVL